MQQIYSNSNFIEITLRHGCSPVNLLHIFRTLFPKNTSGWLLLSMSITKNSGRLLNLFSQVKLKLKQLSNNFVENIKMIDDKIEIAKLFNEYFVNIVKKLGLLTKEQNAVNTENSLKVH